MTRQLVRISTAVMATLLALLVVWEFRNVVLYVLISLMLSAALRPLINRLVGRGFVGGVTWIGLYLMVLGGFGFILFLTVRAAIIEIQQLALNMSALNAWTLPIWLQGTSFQQTVVARLPTPNMVFEAFTGNQGQLILPALLGFAQGIGDVVTGGIIILFLSVYWSLSQIHFERLWLSLLPSGLRKQARGVWRTIEPNIGAYIRSEVIQSLLAGLLLGLGYWLLGSPYPALLALAGALACLIPVIGVTLAVIPALLVGLLTSVPLGLSTALYAIVILSALGVWIKPRLFNLEWDNPILTLIILIAMANAFGLLGIVVAPPISTVCQILWSLQFRHRLAKGASAQISDLRERENRVWAAIKKMDEPHLHLLSSSMERLDCLLADAEPLLQAALPDEPSKPSSPIAP